MRILDRSLKLKTLSKEGVCSCLTRNRHLSDKVSNLIVYLSRYQVILYAFNNRRSMSVTRNCHYIKNVHHDSGSKC